MRFQPKNALAQSGKPSANAYGLPHVQTLDALSDSRITEHEMDMSSKMTGAGGWEAEFKDEGHFVYKSHKKEIFKTNPNRGHSFHTTKGRLQKLMYEKRGYNNKMY